MSQPLGKSGKFSNSTNNVDYLHDSLKNLTINSTDESYYTCMGPGIPPEVTRKPPTGLEYNQFSRNNIIVASKFATPKHPVS